MTFIKKSRACLIFSLGCLSALILLSAPSFAKKIKSDSQSSQTGGNNGTEQGDAPGTSSESGSQSGTQQSQVPELNSKVLSFAMQNQGKQVGDGECWTLAAEALAHAGAKRARGYTFGRELVKREQSLPGDIIQFNACHFEETTLTGWSAFDMGWPNHTAIIQALPTGKTVILHQNFGNDRRVQSLTLDFRNMKSGSFKIYRPVIDDGGYGESDENGQIREGFYRSNPEYNQGNATANSAPNSNTNSTPNPNLNSNSGSSFDPNQAAQFASQYGFPQDGSPGSTSDGPSIPGGPVFPGTHSGPWGMMRRHLSNPDEQMMGKTAAAGGALWESFDLAEGPMYQERARLMERLRQLQSKGVDAEQLMEMFQRINSRARADAASQQAQSRGASPAPAPNIDPELAQAINVLNRLVSIRESRMPHNMQP